MWKDSEMFSKLACPECGANNFFRCMVRSAWVRSRRKQWYAWKCRSCGTELSLSQKASRTLALGSLLWIGLGMYAFLGLQNKTLATLIFIPGYFIYTGVLMIAAGEILRLGERNKPQI